MGGGSYGFESSTSKSIPTSPEIDGLLAGVGYAIRPSDLSHVAERLEKFDSAMIAAAAAGLPPEFLCSDAVHYNPSDLASWVDSMSMLTSLFPSPTHPAPAPWPIQICSPAAFPTITVDSFAPEDARINLVHLLMSCADSINRGDHPSASTLIREMQILLPHVGTAFGIGKVAGYFIDALDRRLLYRPPPPAEDEILYRHFYESSPYLTFAHFTANQAILESFNGRDCVHVIDLSLMHGLQWPALIQALALRPGGPPYLRLTGFGPPAVREVGCRLADLARSVHVPFSFTLLDEIQPNFFRCEPGETVAVNSVLQLHRFLSDPGSPAPIDSVLGWLTALRPRIITVVEQEADHNRPAFLDRFTEALFYYSAMFDSLESAAAGAGAELYLQKEICNIVCCDGEERVERHEPLASWRTRFGEAGLLPVHFGSNAYRQASMLLTLFSGDGYGVEEMEGCLTLSWHGRSIMSSSAWRCGGDVVAPPPADDVCVNRWSGGMSGESSGTDGRVGGIGSERGANL
ncbi:DELLA protein RHT-1-like [Phalaenopsis equestris]|uniref:DELLA protein RHT-1-like n=1 Tax=Phalaenopsis equestris TaxID=78828 RepID=UPI0009E47D4C|nr:DELLA protein RHT-1-like [Phalaenopsis equestris]